MTPISDNRAVSAMFRLFGGQGRPLRGDDVKRLAGPGAHALEARVLGVGVPLVVAVAVIERLRVWCGPGWSAGVVLPVGLEEVQVLAVLIGRVARPLAVTVSLAYWLKRAVMVAPAASVAVTTVAAVSRLPRVALPVATRQRAKSQPASGSAPMPMPRPTRTK